MSVADLYRRIRKLERDFSDRGYVLVRILVPPQNIAPGQPIIVKLVSGYIEDIDVSALPESIGGAVRDRLARLSKRSPLKRDDIERALLLAGELGGLSLRSTFAAGSTAGATRIIVDGTFKRTTGSVSIDRQASEAVGGWNVTGSVVVNSLFGRGEQIYLNYQADPETFFEPDARMRIVAGGAIIPLGGDGLAFMPEMVWASFRPITEPGVPDSRNDMARASAKISYPWLRSVETTHNVYAALDAISQRVRATDFGVTLSSDSYLAMRMGTETQSVLSPSVDFFASARLSQGLGATGSVFSDTAGAPSTHAGAKSTFTKFSGTLASQIDLGSARVTLTGHGQTSFGQSLFNSEQMSLDESDALSGLAPGSAAVDEGVTVRGEIGQTYDLAHSFSALAVSTLATPYVFGAVGGGRVHDVTAAESGTVRAASLGTGVRARFAAGGESDRPVNLGLEVGYGWIDAASSKQGARVNFSLGWAF